MKKELAFFFFLILLALCAFVAFTVKAVTKIDPWYKEKTKSESSRYP